MKRLGCMLIFMLCMMIGLMSPAVAEGTWSYAELEDGTISITGYSDNTVTDFVIPSEVDGKTVTQIGEYAFYGWTSIQTLTLPDSITHLNSWCFSGCSNLTDVTLPANLQSMDSDVFSRTGLTSVVLPDTLTSMKNGNFSRCYNLASVTLSKNLTVLDEGIFWENYALKSIVFPEGLTEIGPNCFISSGLETVTIPFTVQTIYTSTFSGCSSLTTLYTEAGSYAEEFFQTNYPDVTIVNVSLTAEKPIESITLSLPEGTGILAGEPIAIQADIQPADTDTKVMWSVSDSSIASVDQDGVVTFTDSGTVVVTAAANDQNGVTATLSVTYTAPDFTYTLSEGEIIVTGVKEGVTELVIPETLAGYPVVKIDSYAFYDNSSLMTVTIPSCVHTIGYSAFERCSSLVVLYAESGSYAEEYFQTYCPDVAIVSTTPTVENPIESITLSLPEGTECRINTPVTIQAEALPSDAESGILWRLNNNDIATIDKNGALTFRYGGTVTVTAIARDQNGATATLTVTCDDILYAYSIEDGECTITGVSDAVTEAIIPSEIEGCPVTAIGAYAFSGKENITSATVPSGVTRIGDEAFAECTQMAEIDLPDTLQSIGTYAFKGCYTLKAVTIPDSVTEAGVGTFSGCRALEEINIGSGLAYLPERFGENTGSLTSIRIPGNIQSVGYCCIYYFLGNTLETVYLHVDCSEEVAEYFRTEHPNAELIYYVDKPIESITLSLPEGTQILAGMPIAIQADIQPADTDATVVWSVSDTGIASVDQDGVVTFTGGGTVVVTAAANDQNGVTATLSVEYTAPDFTYTLSNEEIIVTGVNSGVTELVIPETLAGYPVTQIAEKAFWYNSSLVSVTIPGSVEAIPASAFQSCTALKTVNLSEGIETIEHQAFQYCSALEEIALPESLIKIDYNAFERCTALKSVTIPDGVTSLGGYAFARCTALEEINLGSGITAIPDNFLYEDTALKSIVIPDGVQSLGWNCFADSGIEVATIPASVEEIYSDSFGWADTLRIVYVGRNSYMEEFFLNDYGFEVEIRYISTPAEDLIYEVEDGVCTILGMAEGADVRKLILAGVYGDAETMQIAEGAFEGSTTLRRVEISCELAAIGDNAFAGCTGLTEVYVVENVTDMGANIFADCPALCYAEIGGNAAAIGEGMFESDAALESVQVDQSVTAIGSRAFAGTGLTYIDLFNGNVTVGEGAFDGCAALEKVYTPIDGIVDDYFAENYPDVTVIDAQPAPDGLRYEFTEGYCMITGYSRSGEKLVIPQYIYGREVRQIGSWALEWDEERRELYLPDGLEEIGEGAFTCNFALEYIYVPDSVHTIEPYAFSDCGFTSFIVPAGVTQLPEEMLAYCSNLECVMIGANVTEIADNTFADCTALTTVYTEEGSYAEEYFTNHEDFPEVKIVYITKNDGDLEYTEEDGEVTVTAYNGSASGVMIPARLNGLPVTKIGDGAFKGMTNLENLFIEADLKEIGSEAFSGCTALQAIDLPESLETIGAKAFCNCKAITQLQFYQNVASIGTDAFKNVPLETVYLFKDSAADTYIKKNHSGTDIVYTTAAPEGVKYRISNGEVSITRWNNPPEVVEIPSEIMGYPVTKIGSDAMCDGSFTELTIPSSVRVIGDYAFAWNSSLKKINFSEGLESIGYEAFGGCNLPYELELPSTLTTIHDFAFTSTNIIGNLTIPESVTYIGECAFDYTQISVLTMTAAEVEMGGDVFNGCENLEILLTEEGSAAEAYFAENYPGVKIVYLADAEASLKYTISNNKVTITGISNDPETVIIPDTIKNKPVTAIGKNAFAESNVANVIMPAGLKTVGVQAFWGCLNLETIVWRSEPTSIGTSAFSSCIGLTGLNLPDSITTIGDNAFECCIELTAIHLPNNLVSLGDYAFFDCSSLAEISVPGTVTSIGECAFGNTRIEEIELSEAIEEIGGSIFYGCDNLTTVYAMPDSAIYRYVQENYPELTLEARHFYMEFEENEDGDLVVSYGRNNPVDLVIPAEFDGKPVVAVGGGAFEGCESLKTLYLSDSITHLSGWCFSGCKNLTSVRMPAYLKTMEDDVFSRTGLTSIVLPDTLTDMLNGNFSRCYKLESVTLSKSLKKLDEGIFWDNYALKSIVIPTGVTEIYENCFFYSGLQSVTIPYTVEKMDESTFEGCDDLTTLYTHKGCYAAEFFMENYPDVQIEYLKVAAEEVTVSVPEDAEISRGTPVQLQVSFEPTFAETDVIWAVDDESMATITQDGVLTFKHGGRVTVTATTDDEFSVTGTLEGLRCPYTTLTLPEDLTQIQAEAFSGSAVENVVVPDSVTSIGARAFADCEWLNVVELPGGTIEIADDAFDGSDVLICAPEGSAAEAFAIAHDIPVEYK